MFAGLIKILDLTVPALCDTFKAVMPTGQLKSKL
jgi:hypothetical protein